MSRKPLVVIGCRRCGKSVTSTNKSLTGADQLWRKYAGICSDCITPSEKHEIDHGIIAKIAGKK